jgi:hypothetical protein
MGATLRHRCARRSPWGPVPDVEGRSRQSLESRPTTTSTAAIRNVRSTSRLQRRSEAEQAGVDKKRRFYFRSDIDKANLAPPSTKATWFRLANVALGNRSGRLIDDQDYVGVAIPWQWPDAFAGVTLSDLCAVQARVAEGRWQENAQAKDWVGHAIADVLDLDVSNKAHKVKIKAMLKQWIANDALVIVEGEDARSNKRSFIEVGEPAND